MSIQSPASLSVDHEVTEHGMFYFYSLKPAEKKGRKKRDHSIIQKQGLHECSSEDMPLVELCTLYLHMCQVRVTVGDLGLCCTCVMYLERQLTPLRVDFTRVQINTYSDKSI